MRLYLTIVMVIVMISLGYRQIYQYFQAPNYDAKAGVLDLRSHDWKENPIVNLYGEWNFRGRRLDGKWDTLIKAPVPGLWNDLDRGDNSFASGIGIGEYQLTIVKPQIKEPLAIMINDYLPSTYELYGGDGEQPLLKVGKISGDSSTSIAAYGPRWVNLPREISEKDTLHLRMVIANHHHRKGGMGKLLEFGLAHPVRVAFNRRVGVELVISCLLLFFGLFNISLYFIFAREKIFLFLGFFCVVALVRIIASNQSVMHLIWPEAPWIVVQRMRYATVSIGYLFILLSFREIMPRYIHRKVAKWMVLAGILITLVFLTISGYGASQLNRLLPAYAFVIVTYLLHRSTRYWQDGNINGSPFLIGGLIYLICGIHDFLLANNLIYGQYYSAYGFLVLALMQGVLVILKFAKIYKANNVLAKDLQASNQKLIAAASLLEEKVRERTEELDKQNQQLRALQAYKHRMTSTLIHDLKTPLQIIIGRNQRDTGDRATLQASQRMLLFVQNLLDVNRAKTEGLTLRFEPLRLVDILGESVERLMPFAQHHQVSIDIKMDKLTFVYADRFLTERIFDNVIHNGIKYSPVQGVVSISVALTEEYINVNIVDQGPGIKEEESALIFDAYQGEKNAEGAHGLGLSFVKLAIEEMGGSVSFKNNTGASGSCFTLSFPKKGPSEVTSKSFPSLSQEERKVFSNVVGALLETTIYDTSTIKLHLSSLPDDGGFLPLKEVLLNLSFSGNRADFIACIQQNMVKGEF
ncbi:ATP-binding protein [Lewinella sp. LCG006]|uniref:sensor histidine kinase n=1 Tax=Lewinella sp. LCG006 TaxID=3231911 RepID=UPI00345F548E